MKRHMTLKALGIFVGALSALGAMPAAAQTRTPWQMHDGMEVTSSNPLGLLRFSCSPARHGDICEYDVAAVPPQEDAGWRPAPNGETIGFSIYSRVCQAPITCMRYGDFTYFQTLVNVPANVAVTQFTIAFSGMDDGSRVTIFNSQYPEGLVIPGSYVYLGGSGTTNLASYVRAGESNRVVITQVDDCCSGNRLERAVVVLNGEELPSGCQSNADCDDGNACTSEVCNADGSCSNPTLVCANGQACSQSPAPPAQSSAEACASPGQPTLVLHGAAEMTLECGVDSWVDPGAQAWDGCGPLEVHTYNSGNDAYGPGPNVCAEGSYSVQYIAWNSQGTTVSAVRTVRTEDRTPPTLTLRGPAHMEHTCGSQWQDPGVDAEDACYGNITPEVRKVGSVNGWVPGTYTVTYTLTDSGGNTATPVSRTVQVANCPW